MFKNWLVTSLVCLFLAHSLSLRAADEKSTDAKPGKTAAADAGKSDDGKAKGRLPSNWGKLGLTSAQKDKVYAVENSYLAKIDELQKMIADLEAKRDAEMQRVLTADQRKQLDTLLADSVKARAAKKAAAADTKESKSPDSGKTAKGGAKNASASK